MLKTSETQCAVNENVCQVIANRLSELQLPNPVEPFASPDANEDFDQATCNLILVAICHQTQNLTGTCRGQRRRGWDHLQFSFLAWAKSQKNLTAEHFASFTPELLTSIIDKESTLAKNDIVRRTDLVRDCGRTLLRCGFSDATELYKHCKQTISDGVPNLLNELTRMRAYNDPVRKKSLYLLGLNQSTCNWTYRDPNSLLPPVDYHEIRGHLRLGSVVIKNDTIRQSIEGKRPVNESHDIAVRTAVTKAILLIGKFSGFTPMQLHYAFWNLFRNVCLRSHPQCGSATPDSLPQDYRHLLVAQRCPFASFCPSAYAEPAIDEYAYVTDWY